VIRAGFESTDPRTGTRSVVVRGADEMSGRGWELEVHCPEGAGPNIVAHLHMTWTETFEIVQGTAACRLGGEQRTLQSGESLVMPPGIPHVHPWNAGTGAMVYRQTNDFSANTPEAVYDVLGAFATINGLAGEGGIGARGLPRNPLQFAATLRTLTKHGGFDAAAPIPLQKFVGATVGRLAEALGYRGVYDRFLE